VARKRTNPYAGVDPKTVEAKKKGYPARSVFKLEEIQKKTQLLKRGMRVVDLGAAPGSWSLYASQQVGQNGRVLAIDLKEITQGFAPNVTVVRGDAFDLKSATFAEHGPFDVILSDMAPKTSGIKLRDQVMSFELFERALEVARTFGKPGESSFVCKIFMGPEFDEAVQLTKKHFKKSRVVRPQGVRQNSKEVFLVGQELRELAGTPPPDEEHVPG
jgi:23S rRNA (uridine2552-2'-O)-methyltransferase